jgi:hypothetical protein
VPIKHVAVARVLVFGVALIHSRSILVNLPRGRQCRCCGADWFACPCPSVFRQGCFRCVNHCGCEECAEERGIADEDYACTLCEGAGQMCSLCSRPWRAGEIRGVGLCECSCPSLAFCGMCSGTGREE